MTAEDVRAQLDHPIVDADGHHVEYVPLIRDFLAEDAGRSVAERFDAVLGGNALKRGIDLPTRRALGLARSGWWGVPARNTLDRATAMTPGLLHDRLDEIGIDVAVLYPTVGLMPMALDDDELRCGLARACNRYYSELYAEYRDRLIPVGIIPTYNPEEAIRELEYATSELGLTGFLFGGLVLRPTEGHESVRSARWVDGLGLDSKFDYDPLWQRCVELGVSPTFHSTGIGFGSRTSPGNYVANHIGNFAAGSEAVCRSLLFGGAPQRFPELTWSFLEGGAAWACTLFADLIGHFEKRNVSALAHYDPRNLDEDLLRSLMRKHAPTAILDRLDRLPEALAFLSDPELGPDALDEFASSGLTSSLDIAAIFGDRFFFGCEADDPTAAFAFDWSVNPLGTQLQAMFASDIGHWDVPDFTEVLDEAWELVEHGHLDTEAFRSFSCDNAIKLFGRTNPRFFAGTMVADHATKVLGATV